nr:MAG TPA: hypothetical protein [Caudoviricetes sp.]
MFPFRFSFPFFNQRFTILSNRFICCPDDVTQPCAS